MACEVEGNGETDTTAHATFYNKGHRARLYTCALSCRKEGARRVDLVAADKDAPRRCCDMARPAGGGDMVREKETPAVIAARKPVRVSNDTCI